MGVTQTFTAELAPITVTQPITYVWQATGQAMVEHPAVSSYTDTVSFRWDTLGLKVITVTAGNVGGTVQATHTLSVVLFVPDITLAHPVLAVELAPGGVSSSTLTIGNEGEAELVWSLAEAPEVGWLSKAPTGGTVPVGGSQNVALEFDAGGLDDNVYTTTLRLSSNDPDKSLIDIPVTLTVESECIALGGADFTFEPASPRAGQVITFTGVVTAGTEPVTYTWSLDEGHLDSGRVITHIYGTPGVFAVAMTATNGCPSFDTAQHDVTVQPAHTFVYLPIVLRRWPPLPDPPVLAAIDNADGDGRYQVSWDSAYLATHYVLEEDTQSAFSDVTQVYSGTDTYVDLEGRGAARYYYRVKARNDWGESDWSNISWVDVLWEMEPNDARGQANGPLVSGLTYYGTFTGTSGTSDYFYLDLPAGHSVELWLSNIPAKNDYDLVLYDDALVMRGYSGLPGNQSEHILTKILPVGRYFVRVYHRSGAGSYTQPYHLRLVYQ